MRNEKMVRHYNPRCNSCRKNGTELCIYPEKAELNERACEIYKRKNYMPPKRPRTAPGYNESNPEGTCEDNTCIWHSEESKYNCEVGQYGSFPRCAYANKRDCKGIKQIKVKINREQI